ncbi:KxYKxGKxW signal peptide domain-containing protein, partial [Staphylococcus microti]
MKKSQRIQKSFSEEKVRVRLYKSGKNWVKAGIKEIQLLKMLGLSLLTDKVDKEQNDKVSIGSAIKDNAFRTTAITGGLFTVNMLHDQHALAASEIPVASELATNSQTVGGQTSVVIEQSQSATDSEQLSIASESQVSDESESADSENTSTDSEIYKAISEEQASLSDSESQSESLVKSESVSLSKDSNVDASESSQSKKTNTSATSEESQQQATASNAKNQLTTAETSTSQSTSISTEIAKEIQNFSRTAFRSVNYSLTRAAATVPVDQVYTGTGYDTLYNLPIYYRLKVTSDGKNLFFQYIVSYDNPNTTVIEKPNVPNNLNVASSQDAHFPMLSLGDGYGVPTTIKNGHTTGFSDTYLTQPAPNNYSINKVAGGNYWWETPIINGFQVKKGTSLISTFIVPITNNSGDLTWTFKPFASKDGSLAPADNYFKETITGTDPITSTSQSQSQDSTSKSQSERSQSDSVSTSVSEQSQSDSASMSTSTSVSESDSASMSTSTSV